MRFAQALRLHGVCLLVTMDSGCLIEMLTGIASHSCHNHAVSQIEVCKTGGRPPLTLHCNVSKLISEYPHNNLLNKLDTRCEAHNDLRLFKASMEVLGVHKTGSYGNEIQILSVRVDQIYGGK